MASVQRLAGATPASAQSSPVAVTPTAPQIEAPIIDADGQTVGSLLVSENEDGATFTVMLDAGTLAEGEHGVHVHETGTCEQGGDEPFALAGGHFNPTGQQHGPPNSDTSHAGDLGNLPVATDGSANFTVTTTMLTLSGDMANSLMDADGSALLIHADPDDLMTDPSGNSGGRLLCAVIFSGTMASPVASPVA
jgi:Cu-Zn family superoxide dismutase